MIDANRGTSEEVQKRLREGSAERFQTQLFESIRLLLNDFQMSWDELAEKLQWPYQIVRGVRSGGNVRFRISHHDLTVKEINEIAHVFSAEPYIIFRPRKPYTQT